jgi:hypothetical protein
LPKKDDAALMTGDQELREMRDVINVEWIGTESR